MEIDGEKENFPECIVGGTARKNFAQITKFCNVGTRNKSPPPTPPFIFISIMNKFIYFTKLNILFYRPLSIFSVIVQYGNVARFINHSCSPNLVPVKVFTSHQDLRCVFSASGSRIQESAKSMRIRFQNIVHQQHPLLVQYEPDPKLAVS